VSALASTPDRDYAPTSDAALFIETLTGDAETPCTWQTFDDDEQRKDDSLARVLHGPLSKVRDELTRLSSRRAGIFVTVNATDLRGRRAENVMGLRALFVDCDTGDLPALPVAPSMVVQSGRGQHAYWLLVPGQEISRFRESQEHLAEALGTDPRIKDLPRVMRVPGFLHQKGEPFRVQLLSAEPDRYFTIQGIVGALPPHKVKPITQWAPPPIHADRSTALERCRRYLANVPGAVQGQGGDDHTYRVACIAAVDFDLPDTDALAALGEWNGKCSPPWDMDLLEAKIQHARRYASGAAGSKLREQMKPQGPARFNVPPHEVFGGPPIEAQAPKSQTVKAKLRFMSAPEYMDAWSNLPEVVTVPTGIGALDRALGGGVPACQVTQIVGGPGARKSEFVRHVRNHCLTQGYHVLHVDVELTVGLMGVRDVSQRADLASAIVRDRKGWNDSQAAGIATALDSIRSLNNLWLLCTPPIGVGDLEAAILETIDHIESDKPKLIILDSLQQLSFGVEARERRHELERFISWANELAQRTGSAVVITSERKRQGKDESSDPLHSAAESRSVEYQCAVMLVLEPEGESGDQIAGAARGQWEQRVRLIVAKNREGQKGKLPDVLVFSGPNWNMRVEAAADELADEVTEALEEGPMSSPEVAAKLKKRRHAVDAVLEWLVTQNVVEKLRISGRSHKIVFKLKEDCRSSDERNQFGARPSNGTSWTTEAD
jgi:KaiC/GvpD/RAD55 family RecA-like ATPase